MALINCPECGKEISDTIEQCPHCGYKIKRKNFANKKLLIFPIVIVAIICIVYAVKLSISNDSPASQAVKIVKADYGKDVNITAIYYNKEQNGCIVEFTSSGISDVACVYLNDKSVGYESVYEKISENVNDASLSDEEKQKYATQVIEYPYDALWVYDLFVNGTSGSEWEKVQ